MTFTVCIYFKQISPLTLPNFASWRKFVLPVKVDKCSPKSHITCYAPMPVLVPNFIALDQTMYQKIVTIFYTHQYFGAPEGSPVPKFTNLGPDVQQGLLYQTAKLCHVLPTPVRCICCQILSISLMAWPTKSSKRRVCAYHAATKIFFVYQVVSEWNILDVGIVTAKVMQRLK